jgi:hypothetical protein
VRKFVCFMIGSFILAGGGASLSKAQEAFVQIPASSFERSAPEAWTVSFDVEKIPRETLFLFLKVKYLRLASSPLLTEVRLNNVLLYRGLMDLSTVFWRMRRFPVSPNSLRNGQNTLTVQGRYLAVAEAALADLHYFPAYDLMTEFEVDLPQKPEPFPNPLTNAKAEPAFRLRGTKGWAWTPEQYLAEVPYLVKAKMNFLMNCYTSMFTSLDPFVNRWWEPLSEAKKRGFEEVVRACQKNNVQFCFSMHPQLFSERPLDPSSSEDFENLWRHYSWMQDLGVDWFNVCYDDIGVEGRDKSVLGETHAKTVNKLLARLRKKNPRVQFIFCPVYYSGCGDTPEARAYLSALGRVLDPQVLVFWTGDGVVTPRITRSCAERYKNIVGHPLVIWDNYPVNDRNPTLHLGPVTSRDVDLSAVAEGYMSNPLCPQNEINRIPMFTCADYAFNPAAYDPTRSIGQAIMHLGETDGQRQAIKALVGLYPGMLVYGDTRTAFNPVLEKFRLLLGRPEGRSAAASFADRVEKVLKQFETAFPDRFGKTKDTVGQDLVEMKKNL